MADEWCPDCGDPLAEYGEPVADEQGRAVCVVCRPDLEQARAKALPEVCNLCERPFDDVCNERPLPEAGGLRGRPLRYVGTLRGKLTPMNELQQLTEDFGGYETETLRAIFEAHPGIPWARAMAEVPHVDLMAPTALARSALAYMGEAQTPLAVMLAAAPEGAHVVAGTRAWVRGARGWHPAGSPSVTLGPETLAEVIGTARWALVARGDA